MRAVLPLSLLPRNRTAWVAFVVFDLLVAVWLIYLWLLHTEVSDINRLRDMGATRYPEPASIAGFSLLDTEGNRFTEQDLLGTWSLIFFGFASCPDVCPLTLAELAQFYRRWKAAGEESIPQVIFVSVDPVRDRPAELAAYLAQFDQEFIGLHGTPRQLAALAKNFHVAYSVDGASNAHQGHSAAIGGDSVTGSAAASGSEQDYSISHSAHVSVVNPLGELHGLVRPPIRSETMLLLYPQLTSPGRRMRSGDL